MGYNSPMSKRFLIVFALVILPLAASADDASQATTTDPALLGPQTTTPAGGSNADAGALQPAGTTPLQSTTSGTDGLSAPNANTLQAPATTDDALKVLAGEGDGAPHTPADDGSNLGIRLLFLLLIAIIVAAVGIVLRDRRRFRDPVHTDH